MEARTFKQAAESYVEHGGCNRYLPRIIEYFGDTLLVDIHPFDIREMAMQLYPDHKNSTRNRHALSPTRAVITHGYDRGWCNLMRLKSFRTDKVRRKVPASFVWLHTFTRQCEKDGLPHLAACVLFMAQTGARVSEAVRLSWPQVDLQGRKALLLRTKTDTNSERFLTDDLVSRFYKLRETAGSNDPVFRYTCRWSVNDRIMAVCKRAGISYKSSHACGRHSFATNAISMGMDIKSAMEAGGWRSASVFIETYVHSRNAGRAAAERFNGYAYDSDL